MAPLSFYNIKSKAVKLGIIFSILFALIFGISSYNSTTEQANKFAISSYNICLQISNDITKCDAEKFKSYQIWLHNRTANAVATALIPIPFFWIYTFIIIYIFRIFRTGFKKEVSFEALNLKGKVTVLFLTLTTATTALFGGLMVGNMYTDTRVPVTLPPFLDMVFDNYMDKKQISAVYMSGTWEARTVNGELVKLASPLQTSKIECYKDKMECFESRAEVTGNALRTELLTYQIEKWNDTEIIFIDEAMCAKTIYSANLTTKSVTGINQKIDSNLKNCEGSAKDFEERYQLVNGFDIYWREHQKARPFFIKAIQALFGN